MKKIPLLFLILSLGANAVLLVMRPKRPDSQSPSPAKSGREPAAPAAMATPTAAGKPLTEEELRSLAITGDLIANSDLPSLVTRLRAAGFAPDIVRAIIAAQVTRDFGARRKAVVAHQEIVPFWKSSQTFPNDPKAGAAISSLMREQNKVLKQLLGSDALPSDSWSQLMRERQYGYLPEGKVDALQDVVADYAELRNRVYGEARGMMLPEDREKLAMIEKEQRADLANLLTPAELENYELRTSNLANQLRFQLAGFNPTEEEFRAIYNIQKDFNAATGANGPGRMQNGEELTAQIKNTLTPERAAAYVQASDPAFQQVNRVLDRLDLPGTLAPQIVSVQKDLSQRAIALQNDQSLTADDRNGKLADLQNEAKTKLIETLGERGYEIYKSQAGSWLTGMVRPNRVRPAPRQR